MKLATLHDGSRDGQLVVVSRDLSRCMAAPGIATTLQRALDDWCPCAVELREVYDLLNGGDVAGEPFDETACLSPLPRAFQWADGSAYVNHVELVRKARGAERGTRPRAIDGVETSGQPPRRRTACTEDAAP